MIVGNQKKKILTILFTMTTFPTPRVSIVPDAFSIYYSCHFTEQPHPHTHGEPLSLRHLFLSQLTPVLAFTQEETEAPRGHPGDSLWVHKDT